MSRPGVATTWLALLACGLAACAAPEPAASPLRLLELRAGVEVERPSLTPEIEAGLVKMQAKIGSLPAPGLVVELPIEEPSGARDSRAALLAPGGSRYRFHLTLPPRPFLRLALGYLEQQGNTPRRVRFLVSVAAGGSSTSLLDESLQTGGGWQEREIDLSRWSGREISLDLSTETDATEAATLAGAWAAPEIESRSGGRGGFDLVLISLDTLRADHLGVYGHRRPTSPNLDAFAEQGVRFATAISQAPWTRPSHRTMLTGLYPNPSSNQGFRAVPLASMLWAAGYRTGALTGGGQIDDRFGFHEGFEMYQVRDWIRSPELVADYLAASPERSKFLFLHTFEIHDPYIDHRFAQGLPAGRVGASFGKREYNAWRSRLTAEERTYVEALYDGDIAFVDEQLGKLFALFEQRHLFDRAVVVVTSDHGEEFWEHGSWRHGARLCDHQLHVPLLVRLPSALVAELRAAGGRSTPPGVVGDQVRVADLYPTLLELLGVPPAAPVRGRSLVPLLRGEPLPELEAFAENTNLRARDKRALRLSRYKLVHTFPRGGRAGNENLALFDLDRDPAELSDIAGDRPELVESLMQRLVELRGEGQDPLEEELPRDVDPDLRQRLEALGYLGD